MPPQETPSKESPDPINVLISIIKPGWKRVLFLILPAIGLIIAHFIYYSDSPSTCINIIRLCLTIITVIYIGVSIGEAYKKKSDIIDSFHKNQPQFFTIIVVLGGTLAILIPMIMNVTKLIGDGAPLTTALLGITGGIIAIFGYYKTHQKSELEREQLETQKQKDVRDHIRQLYASYNDRFDKAVAELNSNDVKAAYTAVPKLAKLADAWLDYEDLSNDTEELEKLEKKAKKEAQTIINVLCKYIRTLPNNYTTEQLSKLDSLSESDKKDLAHEADIRRLIFSEISDRTAYINNQNGLNDGPWSEFQFNFQGAPMFYSLSNIFFAESNFEGSIFYKDIDFRGSHFRKEVNFRNAIFEKPANFSTLSSTPEPKRTIFSRRVTFDGAHFLEKVDFNEVIFHEVTFCARFGVPPVVVDPTTFKDVTFIHTEFRKPAVFDGSRFTAKADFSYSRFKETASFNHIPFEGVTIFHHTKFFGESNFIDTEFYDSTNFISSRFKKDATFIGAFFAKETHFEISTFENVNFMNSRFIGGVNFKSTIFRGSSRFNFALFKGNTTFLNTIFEGNAYFINAKIEGKFIFVLENFAHNAPIFVDKRSKASFSADVDPEDYFFSVAADGKSIDCGTAELLNKSFEIPLGTVLFDPGSNDISDPAK